MHLVDTKVDDVIRKMIKIRFIFHPIELNNTYMRDIKKEMKTIQAQKCRRKVQNETWKCHVIVLVLAPRLSPAQYSLNSAES